ncbi:SDR family NAD(P)-dependent oxidoreductase [Mycobacterium sp. NPDC051198]
MTELRYDDRVVIVTGGGRGVGRSHALLLASKGARVVVADYGVDIDGAGSSAGPATEVVAEIKAAGGQAVPCFASVADEAGAAAIVDTALQTYGRLDALINNAGIHVAGALLDLSTDQFRSMLDVHYFGTLFVTKAAWPHLVQAGYGRVVNTVSEAMLGGIPEHTGYGGAKGAVFGLTRTLAGEGAAHGILVNAIAPRAFTRMSAAQSDKIAANHGISTELMDQINAAMPPDLCAPAAAFLAHDSCLLSGEILRVGLGGVARIAVVASQGINQTSLTAEDIAENLGTIMDLSAGQVSEAVSSRPVQEANQ